MTRLSSRSVPAQLTSDPGDSYSVCSRKERREACHRAQTQTQSFPGRSQQKQKPDVFRQRRERYSRSDCDVTAAQRVHTAAVRGASHFQR